MDPDERDHNVSADPGELLGLKFKANRSTGYQWKLKQNFDDHSCIKLISNKYKKVKKGFMGSGGFTTMKFRVVGDAGCKQTVKMAYARPW